MLQVEYDRVGQIRQVESCRHADAIEGSAPPARSSGRGGGPLPCLKNNNSDRTTSEKPDFDPLKWVEDRENKRAQKDISGYSLPADFQRAICNVQKAAYALEVNAAAFVELCGLERVGFLTLTTPDNLSYWEKTGWREASRRLNNFMRRAFPDIFGASSRWIKVVEPMQTGRIHFHLLVECSGDIRTGFDFDAIKRRDYRTAGKELRGLWGQLRKRLPAYGFGRSELLPIRKTGPAVAAYVGKYLGKSAALECSQEMVKKAGLPGGGRRPSGSRRVAYSSGWRVATSRMAWIDSGRLWREAMKHCAAVHGWRDTQDVAAQLGSNWAYQWGPVIVGQYLYDMARERQNQEQ